MWTATSPSLGPSPYHPSWYQTQLPWQVLSLSKCQLRKQCKPKNRDNQRPCKVKSSHGVVLSETCTFRGPSPGVGDQVKAATRTSQVSQVTSRAPALRLCSHQSILLSTYHVPCVASVLISVLCCCSLVCFITLSFCLHPLSPFSVVCGAPSGESKTHQESTAFCRLFEPTRSAARAAGQRASAAHQEQVRFRSPPSVVRLLSSGQYE